MLDERGRGTVLEEAFWTVEPGQLDDRIQDGDHSDVDRWFLASLRLR